MRVSKMLLAMKRASLSTHNDRKGRNTMTKRFFALLMSLCIIFSMIPVLGVTAAGAETEFSLNHIGYQGNYPRYLVYLDLAGVTDVSATTVPDGSKVVATVNGSSMNLWAYTASSSQIFLVFEVALGNYVIEIDAGTKIGSYTVKSDLKIKIDEYTAIQLEIIRLGIDTTAVNGGVNFSGLSNTRYGFYLTGLSGYDSWNVEHTLVVNGTEHTRVGNGTTFEYCPVGDAQYLFIYYDFLTKGATDCGDITQLQTISIPAGTIFGNCITENTLSFTIQQWTFQVLPPSVSIVSTSGSAWSGSQYILYLHTDTPYTLNSAQAVTILVNGTEQSVWLNPGATPFLSTESTVAYGENKIVIPAGTKLGDCMTTEDYTFYTHADGSIDTNSPSSAVNFTFASGIWQASNNPPRYLVYLNHDHSSDLNVGWVPNSVLSVDGTDQSVYAIGGTQLMLVLDSTVGITQPGEHTVTLKKGTYIGDYQIASDVTFYTHVDGTVDLLPPSAPVNFSFNKGTWQFISENNIARYLIWLEADIDEELSIPWEPLKGLTVNGEPAEVYATVDSGMVMLILDKTSGITQPGKYTIALKQGSYIGKYENAQDITLYTNGLTVSTEAPAQIPEPTETVKVTSDSRNLNGDCTDGFYFQVDPADALPYDEKSGSIGYSSAEGGIYVNGELTQINIFKWLPNLYYVPLRSFGYPPQKGDVVTVDGVFGNGDHGVRYQKQSFVYDGAGNWELGTYLRDLREQEYLVQDISELKMGLSEFELEPGVTLIGEAQRGTNIAIRTVVSTDLGTDEFNFGFSKIEGMWDTQKSGWQVWLRPEWNQVFLAHGETEWQATSYYEFTKEEFTVEFGTVNMDEYINGENVGLYCRKIYLKIDGVEVLSYKDTDLSRNVGKKLFVLNSEDAVDSKLISLTSQGVTLRKLSPTVYDYYDLTGFATDTIAGGSTVCLGETATSTNVALRMKMNLSTNATEVRLALSKQQKDNFWDAAGSGWQVWLRPKWDMLYIAHGENDYEVIMGYDYSSSFTLEFGTRDIIVEKDGKYIGTYCREVYLLIDGEEVATWEDTDFSRALGNCVMMLTSLDSATSVFTRQQTVSLPAQIVVNGETVEACDLLKLDAQVVSGKDSKISLIYSSDDSHKTIFGGLYHNGEKLEPLEESDGKVVYLLKAPTVADELRVELTVKELTTDAPTAVFDLFDMTGKEMVEVPARTTVSVGAMVSQDGQTGVNSAVRFAIRLPKVFNGTQITILGDSASPWSNSGAMLQIISNQINFCHPAMVARMDSFACDLFTPGSLVCMEFGIVKCYENGIYKYDRWYVKAGETVEEMELVGWYDSAERGHYGAHFCCHGSDMEESYYLYSLKNIYSLTDESTAENQAMLRTYEQLTNILPELYYPKALVGYSSLEQAEQSGRISFYTKPGTRLSRFTVNGADVTEQVIIGTDGAYVYTLPGVTGDVRFAYEIVADDTRYTVTASGDEQLKFTLPEDGVLAGDDLSFAVMAQKGYVPQVTVNGTDVMLTVNEETGVWYGTVKSIRQDTEITGKAVEKNYTISVNTPNNGSITLAGDVLNGQLPFGGRLEVIVQPDHGYYVQSVFVGGVEMPVDENGKVTLPAVYWDLEEISVEATFAQANVPALKQSADGQIYIWIGLGVLIAGVAVALLLLKRKSKKEEMKK